jgi:putative transposase
VICIEDLKVKNISQSAQGTVDKPGKNVWQKSGLNRRILAQGWGLFRIMLEYKSVWFGIKLIKVPPAYTSQRWP